MDLLAQYQEIERRIHKHFGYEEDWVKIPLADQTSQHWFLSGEAHGDFAVWSPKPITIESIEAGADIFSGPVYTQRFLPKWVYRADDCTMVSIDTRTDGNRFLMVFDNAKEQKDEALQKAYIEKWGRS